MMMSGCIAEIFLAVSMRVSPLVVLLVDGLILKVSALIRLAAISKDKRVRVEGSKKRLMMVRPRSVGTFLMGRAEISLKESAVLRIYAISSVESCSIPRICRCEKVEPVAMAPPVVNERDLRVDSSGWNEVALVRTRVAAHPTTSRWPRLSLGRP